MATHAQPDLGGAASRCGDAPALVIGDFNATPWSNAAPLLAQGGWHWFGGVQPTWPHSAWGIPIDAVWGQGAWAVLVARSARRSVRTTGRSGSACA